MVIQFKRLFQTFECDNPLLSNFKQICQHFLDKYRQSTEDMTLNLEKKPHTLYVY